MFCPGTTIAAVVNSSRPLVYDCSDLEPETHYEISVSAVNGAGNSSKSSLNTSTTCDYSGSIAVDKMIGNMFNISVSNCTVEYVPPITTVRLIF